MAVAVCSSAVDPVDADPLTAASRRGYDAVVSRDRQRAVERYAKDRHGRPSRLCAQCGATLVSHEDGASCGSEPRHNGTVPAPTATEAALLLRMERGGFEPTQLPVRSRARLAYLVLQRHGWGQHVLCGQLPDLLQRQDVRLECEAPHPASIEIW